MENLLEKRDASLSASLINHYKHTGLNWLLDILMILKHIRFEQSKVNSPNERDALLKHEYRSITKVNGNLMCIKNLAKTPPLSLGTTNNLKIEKDGTYDHGRQVKTH